MLRRGGRVSHDAEVELLCERAGPDRGVGRGEIDPAPARVVKKHAVELGAHCKWAATTGQRVARARDEPCKWAAAGVRRRKKPDDGATGMVTKKAACGGWATVGKVSVEDAGAGMSHAWCQWNIRGCRRAGMSHAWEG